MRSRHCSCSTAKERWYHVTNFYKLQALDIIDFSEDSLSYTRFVSQSRSESLLFVYSVCEAVNEIETHPHFSFYTL